MTKKGTYCYEKESVSSVKSKQLTVPDWMTKALEGLSDDDIVTVTRQYTPFGTFVIGLKK